MKTSANTNNTHVSKGDRLNWARRSNASTVKLDVSKTKGVLVSSNKAGSVIAKKVIS